MMDWTTLITNPNEVTFALLFMALLGYVIKTNGDREGRYLQTIETLSDALHDNEEVKKKVAEIYERVV